MVPNTFMPNTFMSNTFTLWHPASALTLGPNIFLLSAFLLFIAAAGVFLECSCNLGFICPHRSLDVRRMGLGHNAVLSNMIGGVLKECERECTRLAQRKAVRLCREGKEEERKRGGDRQTRDRARTSEQGEKCISKRGRAAGL